LGTKQILRTKDAYHGPVTKPEIEDTLRATLIEIAKTELGWDVSSIAMQQPGRPIIDIFEREITGFSKYRLAKAFLRWVGAHAASDLSPDEQRWWTTLINAINRALR
jgi:hypothetical protein